MVCYLSAANIEKKKTFLIQIRIRCLLFPYIIIYIYGGHVKNTIYLLGLKEIIKQGRCQGYIRYLYWFTMSPMAQTTHLFYKFSSPHRVRANKV